METPARNTVAIVGRPNVGKSALFNRLAGRRISIVHDQPGVTRDRLGAECRLGREPFDIVDTGGIGSAVDASFTEQVRTEADIAMATADLILFIVDGQDGVTPVDLELASQLRRVDKPLILVVNKIDHPKHETYDAEFAALGFGTVTAISAEHGRGIAELVSEIENALPDRQQILDERGEEIAPPLRLAIVGRPNVGKSSLVNAILQDSRTLVSDISGTTRDAIDIPYTRKDQHFILIDTAGIRPRGKRSDSVEVFSVMRSEKSIRRCDLCLLVIDVTEGVTAQDKKIAGLIQEARKPCIVIANKWDLAKPDTPDRKAAGDRIDEIRANLFFLDYAPVIPLSAKTGENMRRVFRFIDQVRSDAAGRITTGPLNRLLQQAIENQPPPIRSGKRFKLLYATQVEPRPDEAVPVPHFLFFVNDPKILPSSYQKFLEGRLREVERFSGLPLVMQFRGREPRKRD